MLSAYYKRIFFFLIACSSLFFFTPKQGFCHRVDIFCWVEGDQIKCEAKFTPGGPVKSGEIVVYSQQTGKKLLTRKTDQEGKASFKIPDMAIKKRWDLKVVCNAEMGHKNFWVVRADELPSIKPGVSSGKKGSSAKETVADREELIKTFSQILSKQLAPVKKDIAELKEKRISLQDVLGGLGYILGLVGVAFYLTGKKNSR